MVNNNLALRATSPVNAMETWTIMREQANMLVKTGFLPAAIKTAEQALAIMLKGQELGIPSMYSLSNIVIVQGKPTCSAELMLALIYRDHGDNALVVLDSTETACTASYKRRAWPEARSYAFTIQHARTAGLMSNPTWQKYAPAMLRARCISAIARMAFPDSIAGMYTPEELGADVQVIDGEQVQIAAPRAAIGSASGADVVDIVTGEIVERPPAALPAGPGGRAAVLYEHQQLALTRFFARCWSELKLRQFSVKQRLGVTSISEVADLNAAFATLAEQVANEHGPEFSGDSDDDQDGDSSEEMGEGLDWAASVADPEGRDPMQAASEDSIVRIRQMASEASVGHTTKQADGQQRNALSAALKSLDVGEGDRERLVKAVFDHFPAELGHWEAHVLTQWARDEANRSNAQAIVAMAGGQRTLINA